MVVITEPRLNFECKLGVRFPVSVTDRTMETLASAPVSEDAAPSAAALGSLENPGTMCDYGDTCVLLSHLDLTSNNNASPDRAELVAYIYGNVPQSRAVEIERMAATDPELLASIADLRALAAASFDFPDYGAAAREKEV